MQDKIVDDHYEGKEEQWTGKWFTPQIKSRYFVPENAGNYRSLRGKTGVCVAFKQTGFGHVWAKMQFDDGVVKWVRTKWLAPLVDNGEKLSQNPQDLDREAALAKATAVWSTD